MVTFLLFIIALPVLLSILYFGVMMAVYVIGAIVFVLIPAPFKAFFWVWDHSIEAIFRMGEKLIGRLFPCP